MYRVVRYHVTWLLFSERSLAFINPFDYAQSLYILHPHKFDTTAFVASLTHPHGFDTIISEEKVAGQTYSDIGC